jgi:hypothetical protein
MKSLQWDSSGGESFPGCRDAARSIYVSHTAKTISVSAEKLLRRLDIFVLPFGRDFPQAGSVGGLK